MTYTAQKAKEDLIALRSIDEWIRLIDVLLQRETRCAALASSTRIRATFNFPHQRDGGKVLTRTIEHYRQVGWTVAEEPQAGGGSESTIVKFSLDVDIER